MPIYEYACLKCGRQFEVMQKASDEPLKRCTECKGKLEKQWSQTSMQFKGAGWYVNDYAPKKTGGDKSGDEKSGGEKSGDDKKADGDKKADAKESKSTEAVKSEATVKESKPASDKSEKKSNSSSTANSKS